MQIRTKSSRKLRIGSASVFIAITIVMVLIGAFVQQHQFQTNVTANIKNNRFFQKFINKTIDADQFQLPSTNRKNQLLSKIKTLVLSKLTKQQTSQKASLIAFLRKQDHGYINRIIEDNPNLNIQKINDQFMLVNQTKQLQTQIAETQAKEMLFQILPDITKQSYSTEESLKNDILKKWKSAIKETEDPILKPLMIDFATKTTPQQIAKWIKEIGWKFFTINKQLKLKTTSQYHEEKLQQQKQKWSKRKQDLITERQDAYLKLNDVSNTNNQLQTQIAGTQAKEMLFQILPDIAKGYSTKVLFKPDILAKWKSEIDKTKDPILKPLMTNLAINATLDQIEKWIKEIGWKFLKINKQWYLKNASQYHEEKLQQQKQEWNKEKQDLSKQQQTLTTQIVGTQAKKILFKILPDIAKQNYSTKVLFKPDILAKWKSEIDKTKDPILKPLMTNFAIDATLDQIEKWIKEIGWKFFTIDNQWYLKNLSEYHKKRALKLAEHNEKLTKILAEFKNEERTTKKPIILPPTTTEAVEKRAKTNLFKILPDIAKGYSTKESLKKDILAKWKSEIKQTEDSDLKSLIINFATQTTPQQITKWIEETRWKFLNINKEWYLKEADKYYKQKADKLEKDYKDLSEANEELGQTRLTLYNQLETQRKWQTKITKITENQAEQMLLKILPIISEKSYSTEKSLKEDIVAKWKSEIDKTKDAILKPLMIDFVTKKTPKIKKWMTELGLGFVQEEKEQWHLINIELSRKLITKAIAQKQRKPE